MIYIAIGLVAGFLIGLVINIGVGVFTILDDDRAEVYWRSRRFGHNTYVSAYRAFKETRHG